MKNRILKTLAIVGLMTAISITTASAYARTRVTAYIPFDFVAGEKTLPAGEYTIKNASRHLQDALLIQSADGKESVLILTSSITGKSIQKTAKLVFHQYGDRHFLAQVWSPGGEAGRAVRESRAEQELVREIVRSIRTIEAGKSN